MKAWIIHAFIFAFNIYFAFDAELSAVGTPTLSITGQVGSQHWHKPAGLGRFITTVPIGVITFTESRAKDSA
jgi:hypothetical protein